MFSGDSDTTKIQDCILNQYDMAMNADVNAIASHCDCSASYVRETLNEHRSGWDDDNNALF